MTEIIVILAILFLVRILLNILVVFSEKSALKNNIIIIDKSFVTQSDLEMADQKIFIWKGLRCKAGDELLIMKKSEDKKGILLGINTRNQKILLASDEKTIEYIPLHEIKRIKRLSQYGKFFNI